LTETVELQEVGKDDLFKPEPRKEKAEEKKSEEIEAYENKDPYYLFNRLNNQHAMKAHMAKPNAKDADKIKIKLAPSLDIHFYVTN